MGVGVGERVAEGVVGCFVVLVGIGKVLVDLGCVAVVTGVLWLARVIFLLISHAYVGSSLNLRKGDLKRK